MTSTPIPHRPRTPAEWTARQEEAAGFGRSLEHGMPMLMGVLAMAGSYLALTLAPGAFFRTPQPIGVYQAMALATGIGTGLFLWFVIHEANRRPSFLDAATPDVMDNVSLERWKDEPDVKAYLQTVRASGVPLLNMDMHALQDMCRAHSQRADIARAARIVDQA